MAPLADLHELSTPCAYYLGSTGAPKGKPAEEEDDIDLFGEETAEDKEALKKLSDSKKNEKKKKQVINKSMLVIEVKPSSSETNLDDIEKEIRKIQIEGLTWGENTKKVPIAFGLYKLQVQCVILDDIVETQSITDRIEEIGMNEEDKKKREAMMDHGEEDEDDEELSGLVQSAEIVSFNKL
ncbi:elongation factor 1-beta [Cyclospora cayetanensis]|uniref:Elongation factor 1-beta n=2 Tax=Cyclospora cayetanensis TaxID=88456 RepID=A0A6P5WCN5_9EIME|nr:elongation factor 1-beta [Cyclospora cayetanensis]OEH74521.1 EF-1 guanine nucleotide exchange domain-containing protein [Cyclospora cayetanensis]